MRTLLTNATLIDAVQPDPRPATWVLIGEGSIQAIGPMAALPAEAADATAIDLRGAVLMPGLWDVHVHPDFLPLADVPLPEQMTRFGAQMMAALTESGIVGMRSAGTHSYMDVAWKKAFDSGQFIGPNLYAAGHFLTTSGGHFLNSGHALECDGPYGFVKAIREQIRNGVDHIKLNLTGGIMGPSWDKPSDSFFLPEELKAAFDICHLRGFKVMAHATHPEAVKLAIRLGAHSVEHGYTLDDECIELFLEHDTWYVPTLAISHLTPDQAGNDWERRWVKNRNLAQALCCRADAASGTHREWFVKALKAGVKMALGSDIRPLKDAALLEMGLWVRDGATPWQTLVAATRNSAAICGMGETMGTLEVGKRADLIVVDGDPLEDVHNVRRLALVIKDGRVVADRRPAMS